MKKILGWGLGIFVGLGIIGSFIPEEKSKTSNLQPSSTKATTSVTKEEPKKVEVKPKTTPKVETTKKAEPEPEPQQDPEPAPKPQSNCNPNYSPCIPNSSSDLDCADIGFTVTVTGSDVYRLDRDHDGYGCE